jgi:hypothetical protein
MIKDYFPHLLSNALIADRLGNKAKAIDFAQAARKLTGRNIDRIGLLVASDVSEKLWKDTANGFAENTKLFAIGSSNNKTSKKVRRLVVVPQKAFGDSWGKPPAWIGPKFELVVETGKSVPALLIGMHTNMTYDDVKDAFSDTESFPTPGLENFALSVPVQFPEAWGPLSRGRLDIHYAVEGKKAINDDWLLIQGRRVRSFDPAFSLSRSVPYVA